MKKNKTSTFKDIFDITNTAGNWLCSEDKAFYELQLKSKGKAGYCTHKDDSQKIHPSKRVLESQNFILNTQKFVHSDDAMSNSASSCVSTESDFTSENEIKYKRSYHSTRGN